MPSYIPPKKNTSFVFYTAFVDTANQPDFKANPTIASGDFKLSIDDTSGVALTANPAVVTGATTVVRFTVTAAEMNGDNINILCVDAAGGEWDDQFITIATAAFLSDDISAGVSANLTAINSNAVGISANLTAINSNAVGISANLTAINSNATALGIVKSDTVVIRSDTLAAVAGISANLTAINSNATALGIVKSDLVVIRSDTLFTRSEAVSILADTGTTVPGLISANLTAINSNATALGVLKSDSVVIRSDVLKIRSDVAALGTDAALISDVLTAVNSNAVGISANLAAINSNATALGIVKSDTLFIRSDAASILTDTGTTLPVQISANLAAINSNAVGISANLTSINSNVTSLGVLKSDTVVIRSDVLRIRSDTAAILTDTGTTRPALLPTALVSGRMDADVGAISTSTEAADNLEASAETIVIGAAEAGTLSTTVMTSDLTEATDEHYNGRIVIWTSGVLQDQASDITAYLGATGRLTYTAVTEAPGAGDTFIIV